MTQASRADRDAFMKGCSVAMRQDMCAQFVTDRVHVAAGSLLKLSRCCDRFLEKEGVADAIERIEVHTRAEKDGEPCPAYYHAGAMFWHTATGAGAGFWDGDWSFVDGELLTRCSKDPQFRFEFYMADNGTVHLL